MKAGVIIGSIALIVVVLGVVFWVSNKITEKNIPSNNSQVFEQTPSSTESTTQALAGNYITGLAADGFRNSTADKIVLFFYASWCPTCRPVDAEFKDKITQIPAGIEIYRINYNDPDTDEAEKALAQKYDVTYQHTFVQVDKEGNEITKWNGGGLDNLLSKIK